ncbi:MAG: EAL domain-containing protein [gamma proteobacterium symbiont of Taylorina sp.]|nr:EAL domain-containing protein [gamma proteobacterium symbiont of Taylorina sp.]
MPIIGEISERESTLFDGYNKLEEVLKLSQLVTYVFEKSVLNEIRYFARAYVDVRLSTNEKDRESAFGRAEAALSAAFTDVLDALVNHIKVVVRDIRAKFIQSTISDHLADLGYENALLALKKADNMILQSRANRNDRFKNYVSFSNATEFKHIVDFSFNLTELERRCELDKSSSTRKLELQRLRWVREALSNTTQDPKKCLFKLFVQPKYSAKTGSQVGVEALIRLFRPNTEFPMTPNIFLDDAHRANLGHEIGLWVLNEAIKILCDWKNDGVLPTEFDFAINLSPSLAGNDVFNQIFREKARDNGLVQHISIEITEDWISDAEEHKSVSHSVSTLPEETRIAIDDFGTGTTKIEYLAIISGLTSLKIDKSLVDGLLTRNKKRARALITGIIALAKENNLKVVAEGIEVESQKDTLVSLGIDELQGFLLSRPIQADIFKLQHLSPELATSID